MANTPADTKFNLGLNQWGARVMPYVGAWKAKRYLDYHCLYGLIFSLLVVDFSCSHVGLDASLFLPLSVTFYYSLIEKTNVKYVPIYTLHPLFYFKATYNFIFLYSPIFYFGVISNSILSYSR